MSMGRGDRPEHTAPPEIFYNDNEARKYTTNSRMVSIQVALLSRNYFMTEAQRETYMHARPPCG